MTGQTGVLVGMLFLAHAAAAQYTQQGAKLVGTGAVGRALQGTSVAISSDGTTLIVGGPGDSPYSVLYSGGTGAVWMYTRTGSGWSQQGSKLVGTGSLGSPQVQQGYSVAISADGDTAVVGGPDDNSHAGAAWVYTRRGGMWSQQGSKLVGTDAVGSAQQGTSVAISADGSTVIVGGPHDGSAAGAAWVYTRREGMWSQQGSKLVGTDAVGSARKGTSVAISADGNTAVVGGPGDSSWAGAAWVFTQSGGVWSQQGSKLVGMDAVGTAQQGTSVAISADGNTAIVGGPKDSNDGAAWLYSRSGGVWSQQGSKLVGTDAVGSARQGTSVAISADGDTAVVGGPKGSDGGAAWVYSRSGGVWSQQGSSLVGADANGSAELGLSVAISADGTTAILGGPKDYEAGGAWVFTAGCVAPWVIEQPASRSLQSAHSTTLFVHAVGTAPLSYQWYQGVSGDTSNPAGTDASSLATPELTTSTSYWVRVSNTCGHVDSTSATITVIPYVLWVPVASHGAGLNQSQWRSDLGLLNIGAATANVQVGFLGRAGVATETTQVSPGAQSILTDVVGWLGASDSGAIQVVSDQALKVTARSYNQISSSAVCYPNGTQGQDYPAVGPSDGLTSGHSAYLSGLTENASYRCNIGVVSLGPDDATVLVELFDGAGAKLAEYTVWLPPGRWVQETQPFLKRAGQSAMDRGYAKITVQSGSGVFGFASVIDNHTNDPTTMAMLPSLAPATAAQLTQQGAKLVGSDASGAAWLGYSVAISADGSTAVAGGPQDDSGVGAAWVYTRSGGAWWQQGSKLVGTDAVGAAQQGYAVAISADGNTAIVGGPQDRSGAGAAWVFTRTGGVWSQQGSKLVGAGAAGSAVAISADGDTAILGGPQDDGGIGAAWVYTRTGGVWSQQGSRLVGAGSIGSFGANQGWSVAVSADGSTAVVGGPGDGRCSSWVAYPIGAAWVFTRSGGAWSQQGPKLVGDGGAASCYGAGQGWSVAISADGNTVVVGGPVDDHVGGWISLSGVGAAWVYTRSEGVWSQQGSKLVGLGRLPRGASEQGRSVAISADGNTAIVGAPGENGGSISYLYRPGEGAAWVYTRSNGVWSQQGSKLVGTGAVTSNYWGAGQGSSVAISADGSTVVVGGYGDSSKAGAAWVFSAYLLTVWVPVASHNPGLNHSLWRSDLGLLNTGTVTANVQVRFFGSGGVVSKTTYVPPATQSILTDVVAQLDASGSGAIEVIADQPIEVTARSYNKVASDASCYANGTQGQDYPVLAAIDGLSAGQSAHLAGLTENASYRSNIGVVSLGPVGATVLVELFDGMGTKLTDYTVTLATGRWVQETQPFQRRAGQTAMGSGYAKITVQSGSGVFGFASVIDNRTNDPTTVAMQR